jgi:hypothetical protein
MLSPTITILTEALMLLRGSKLLNISIPKPTNGVAAAQSIHFLLSLANNLSF